MAKRDEAALKLLRWELQGYGKIVMEAMVSHPDKNLAEAVDLIEQEVPDLSPSDPHSEMPAPVAARPRASSELDAFFFQAEAGIRDVAVTGVQTCALPI